MGAAGRSRRRWQAPCARTFGCVAAITGQTDVVSDGTRVARVCNGHELMSRVTGTGCMSTAVTAAYAAVEKDWLLAAASALAAFGLAGEIAAQGSPGPGTFHVRLYDALAQLTRGGIARGGAHRDRGMKLDLRVYVITTTLPHLGRDHLAIAEAAVRGGATVLQFRDKTMRDAEFAATATRILSIARQGGVPLIVNDRVEIAAAIGAEGVHVGRADAAVARHPASCREE